MIVKIKRDTPVQPFHKHWQFCVGSPHATYALRKDYCAQLLRVREELGVERVRFHGIFGDDMHTLHKASDILPIPGGKRYTERSFRWCGVAYDNILAAGMRPFVELGFMPRHLAKRNKKGLFFYKPVIAQPKSEAAWRDYIQAFVRFLIGRYGAEEVERWYFEVWNEPDLRLPFFDGTKRDYFRLYEVTARAVKDVDANIRVGGPSTSASKWVGEFVDFCKAKDVPLDFVSTHQYAGDPLGGIEDGGKGKKPKLHIDLFAALRQRGTLPRDSALAAYRAVMGSEHANEGLRRDTFAQNAELVRREAQGLPVYYTEWNLCASFGAPCNDTRMVAAYDALAALATERSVAGSSVWCFTDLFEELHPFPEEFHGGFGLLTQSGIPKPAFHALKMLQGAGSERYVLPDAEQNSVGAAAFRSENGIQVLLARLEMNPRSAPKEPARVEIELDRAPARVTLRRIDEEHANPFKVWQEMGAPLVPTAAQVERIKEASALIAEEPAYVYEEGLLSLSAELCENDVYFIEIEY